MDVSKLEKSAGFTLVELPDFSDIIKNNRATARINELQTSLTFARTEAVKSNTPVIMCKSTDEHRRFVTFRITARAWGEDPNSLVQLKSTYRAHIRSFVDQFFFGRDKRQRTTS